MAIGAYLSLRAGILREPVIPHLDKLLHALGYGVLAMLACGLFTPGHARRAALLWLMLFGGLIELAQGVWTVNRLADPWDLLANACGIDSFWSSNFSKPFNYILRRKRSILRLVVAKWISFAPMIQCDPPSR